MQRLSIIFLLALAILVGSAAGQKNKKTIGMVADFGGQVCIFDADSDTLIGSVAIPGATWWTALFDCVITRDQKQAFVTDFNNLRVWVIDLTASPPTLASGTNPIPLTIMAVDLSMTADGKFLLASDGLAPLNLGPPGGIPFVVIDVASRTQIRSYAFGKNTNANAVEVCPDGSVLVIERTSPTLPPQPLNWKTRLRRLHIDEFGILTDTGQYLTNSEAPNAMNVAYVVPRDSREQVDLFGVFVSRSHRLVGSFKVDGMKLLSTQTPSGPWGIDVVPNVQGNRIFVTTNSSSGTNPAPGEGFIDAFQFHTEDGRIGHHRFTIALNSHTGGFFGLEQMTFHPKGKKLYVPARHLPEVRIYDANHGTLIGILKTPSITSFNYLTGITIVGPETED